MHLHPSTPPGTVPESGMGRMSGPVTEARPRGAIRMNAQVLEVLRNSAGLPSVPQVVTRVLQIMRSPDFDYEDVVRAVSADTGSVSDLLKLANSPLFGVRNKVGSLRQALTLLGPKRTRSLLLGRYLVSSMNAERIEGIEMDYFWRRSLSSAVLASHLSQEVLPEFREEAFISALLAKMGMVILAKAMPERYGSFVARYAPHGGTIDPKRERAVIGATHGEVSAMVLTHWELPDVIATVANLHQSPPDAGGEAGHLARIVCAAYAISRLLCEVPDVDHISPICREAASLSGVSMETLADLLTRVEADIEELADILRIDVIQSSVYLLIARTVKEHLEVAIA